jgi:hypothetical protein
LGEIGRTEGAPLEPGLDEFGHGLAGGAAVLAGTHLADQAGLQLAGLRLGSGRAGLLALAAGERVAAGVDDDHQRLPRFLITRRLLGHPPEGGKDDQRMIRRQANSPRPLTWGVGRAARDSNPQPPDP